MTTQKHAQMFLKYSSQKVETTHMSITWGTHKQNGVHPYVLVSFCCCNKWPQISGLEQHTEFWRLGIWNRPAGLCSFSRLWGTICFLDCPAPRGPLHPLVLGPHHSDLCFHCHIPSSYRRTIGLNNSGQSSHRKVLTWVIPANERWHVHKFWGLEGGPLWGP